MSFEQGWKLICRNSSLEYPSLAQDVFAYSLASRGAKGLKLDEALKLRSESSWLLRPREEGLQTKKIIMKMTIALRARSCMLNICWKKIVSSIICLLCADVFQRKQETSARRLVDNLQLSYNMEQLFSTKYYFMSTLDCYITLTLDHKLQLISSEEWSVYNLPRPKTEEETTKVD